MATSTVLMAIPKVRSLCNDATESDLPTYKIRDSLYEVGQAMVNEMKLSPQNQFLDKQILGTPAKDSQLSLPNYEYLVAVDYQIDSTYDRWIDIPIVNESSLNEAAAEGKFACAVYGTPLRLAFSFDPALTIQDFPVRVWYEPNPVNPSLSSAPKFNESFVSYWYYQAAALCREIHLNLPIPLAMQRMIQKGDEQFKRSVNRSQDQRAMPRTAGYKPTGYGRGRGYY